MATKMVKHTLETLPPITQEERANLTRLAALPNDEIDTSDIPEMTDEQWRAAKRRHLNPVKQQITAQLDGDVLEWLKSQGEGYQARINAILRREMLASLRRS